MSNIFLNVCQIHHQPNTFFQTQLLTTEKNKFTPAFAFTIKVTDTNHLKDPLRRRLTMQLYVVVVVVFIVESKSEDLTPLNFTVQLLEFSI